MFLTSLVQSGIVMNFSHDIKVKIFDVLFEKFSTEVDLKKFQPRIISVFSATVLQIHTKLLDFRVIEMKFSLVSPTPGLELGPNCFSSKNFYVFS